MGNSQSTKPSVTSIICYEEALTRITKEEYEHLKVSYDELLCLPDKENFVTKAFLGLPGKFSEQLYRVFSPISQHLTLERLLCGLAVIMRGTRLEKLQLLFYTMSLDGYKLTQDEMRSSLVSWGIEIPKQTDLLFIVSDVCTFQHFVKWMHKFSPVLGVYDWILDNEGGGFICARGVRAFQTYHQFLAEQASFTEKQVTALEKHYVKLRRLFSRSKRFDVETMHQCLHPLYTYEFSQRFFHAFDLNKDGTIDCRELVIGLSAILEGEDSFARFVFYMFNESGDGVMQQGEVDNFTRVIGSFCLVADSLKLDTDHALSEGTVPVNDFIQWCNNSCSMYKFLSHLKNIVYIVFGVRPDLSFNIIRQWMEMEATINLITGKPYYIANNEWFKGSGGFVNNSAILAPETNGHKTVPRITTEGGTLRNGLLHGIDYHLISQVLWCTLEDWYGCDTAICRRARLTPSGTVILELFPLKLNLYKQPTFNARSALEALNRGPLHLQRSIELNSSVVDPPRHVLAYTGAFYSDDTLTALIHFLSEKLKLGREDLRLWKMLPNHKLVLLDETEEKTLDSLGIKTSNNILIEVRNTDMSWPEEVANIINQNRVIDRRAPTARVNGTTGLNNLGNTCFMNSSIQCLSNTRALSVYFLKELHLREVNQNNPDSLNGLLALRYGTLIKNLWSCSSRTIAPLKMRWTIAKFAPQFTGFGQHDAQELLAFLLDGLHEDLNRITTKPYTQIKDSDDRSDPEVAAEFWSNHVARNRSIIVDLFHGQLKSTLQCLTCGFTSVRFDPFSFLSLPLPENENVIIEVFVVRLDPSNLTTQYCIWLNNECSIRDVKKRLFAKIPSLKHFLFVDVENSVVKRIIGIDEPLRNITSPLYVFELPGEEGERPEEYVVVYSRHYITIDKYFFDWQHRQVKLFGTPFIIATGGEGGGGGGGEGTSQSVTIRQRIRNYLIKMYNFDEDFIDNLVHNIDVKKVTQGGRDCCICPWKELCYGHKLLDSPELGDCGYLTVDWSSAVVHLIHQYDDDVTILQDNSVSEAKQRQSQPVDLSLCMNSFTKEEEVAEWYCKRCAAHKTATKKLDIWRLPPFLIIHLKRFSFQGGKWVKCKRTVSFPDSFDPSPFLVQSSQISISARMRTESVTMVYNTVLVEGDQEDDYDEISITSIDDDEVVNSNNRNPLEQHKNSLSYIASSMKSNNTSKKSNDTRPFYDLYAVTAHTGQIGGGHYVAFSLNPNRQWYYYNDSQVKKTTRRRVLSEPAYILFYERRNLKLDDLLPSYSDRYGEPHFDYDASIIMKDVLQNADKDRKPSCSLQ